MSHRLLPVVIHGSRAFVLVCFGIIVLGCGRASVSPSVSLESESAPAKSTNSPQTSSTSAMESPSTPQSTSAYADVLSVNIAGNVGSYRFSVTIQSPDTGCDQYANWWEVISEEGELLHRRILLHSHVNEQPFSRSSGPVTVQADQALIVRAHMHPSGYGGQALKGTVAEGFSVVELADDFALALAQQEPLPTGCSF